MVKKFLFSLITVNLFFVNHVIGSEDRKPGLNIPAYLHSKDQIDFIAYREALMGNTANKKKPQVQAQVVQVKPVKTILIGLNIPVIARTVLTKFSGWCGCCRRKSGKNY